MPSLGPAVMPELGAIYTLDLDSVDLVATFRSWSAHFTDVVWLDSADHGRHVIGTGTRRLVVPPGGAVFDELRAARSQESGPWVGWIGFEAGVRALGVTPHESRFPDAAWLLLDEWIVVDGDRVQWQSRSRSAPTAVPDTELLEPSTAEVQARWIDDDAAYADRIRQCQACITEGDSYLMCLTTALETPPIDAVATHERLRGTSPVHHGGFVRIGATSLVAASMEQFLHIADDEVETKPIKGTRRRALGTDDEREARALRSSEKEQAENVMIVDLCRNDLLRVCTPESVHVPSLLAVESYPTVHQLVSTIRGTKRPGIDDLDVVEAMFPAGSMTGAPKRRTVELLQRIEGRARGVYSGCFGLMTESTVDLAMVIRSIVADDSGAHIGVGGGITALSVVADEVAEVHLKAAALVDALVPAARPVGIPL